MDDVNNELSNVVDELIINIESVQLHGSVSIINYITEFNIGYGGFIIPTSSSYIDLCIMD